MDAAHKHTYQALAGFGFGLSCAALLNYLISDQPGQFEAAVSLISLLASFAVFFLWCQQFSRIIIEVLDKVFSISLVVMGCAGGVLFLLLPPIATYSSFGYLSMSILLFVFATQRKTPYQYSRKKWVFSHDLLKKPLAYLFLYAVSYGVVIGICSAESVISYEGFSPIPTIAIGTALAGIVVFGIQLINKTPKALEAITRISLVIIVSSLLILLIVEDEYSIFGISTVLSLGFGLFLFLFSRMSFDLYETFNLRFFMSFIIFIAFFLAIFLGSVIGRFAIPTNPQVAVIVCVLVITLVTVYGLGSNRLWTAGGLKASKFVSSEETPQDGIWKKSCVLVAKDAGLSVRETEVFMLMAKGRNAGYIEKVLYISNHTVKAHILKIYRKLEVHSLQELLDLIEARKNSLKADE